MLDELKLKLRVTWPDEDDRLISMIERAKRYLNTLCNMELDYIHKTDARTLLFERCFYDYNNALSEFEKNYDSELARLIFNAALAKNAADNEALQEAGGNRLQRPGGGGCTR